MRDVSCLRPSARTGRPCTRAAWTRRRSDGTSEGGDGRFLAGTEGVDSANDVVVWDPYTRELVRRIAVPDRFGRLGPVQWTPDGRRLVVGSGRGYIAVLDARSGRVIED